MFLVILKMYLIGLVVGYILEFFYRSIKKRRIILPLFLNTQIYAFTGFFLPIIFYSHVSLFFKLIIIIILPTLIEFITGYLYKKVYKTQLWDYSKESYNFMGIICLKFSFYWFILTVITYYLILPLIL